jgi:ParB family transcriptional regulator, chromosome partitioning protein
MKRSSLGRGLGALIEDSKYEGKNAPTSNINEIEVEKIVANPYQPRTEFDEDALNELATSIRELGIIQPITVRKIDDDHYQLISGERRLRASKIAGLTKVPAYVREANDQAMLEMALVENIQRENLNPIEVSITYQRLLDECNLTQETLSDRIGKKRSTVANYLRLLKLPAPIQAGLRDRKISFGHARTIIGIENPTTQIEIFNKLIAEELSVRQLEELVRSIANPTLKPSKKEEIHIPLPEPVQRFATTMKMHLRTNVDIKRDESGKGKLQISFKSDTELQHIIDVLSKISEE